VIGWKTKDELLFLAEGFASDAGRCLEWASSIGRCFIHASQWHWKRYGSRHSNLKIGMVAQYQSAEIWAVDFSENH